MFIISFICHKDWFAGFDRDREERQRDRVTILGSVA